jgi:hypothetical protein
LPIPSKLVVTLKDPGFLLGVSGIDFLLNGRSLSLMHFGDTKEFEIEAGEHVAKLILHGVVDRSSKNLKFSLGEGESVRMEGKYSRAWGNMNISLA